MASYTKSIMASVFEDTKTRQVYLQWISQGTIIHSCKRIAIRFGNVKPL